MLNNFSDQCPCLKRENICITRMVILNIASARADEEIILVIAVNDGLPRGAGQTGENGQRNFMWWPSVPHRL